MAAGGQCGVRVRLVFEYPPPALPESCMLWLLLDTQRCRVVTDLTTIIRQRFFYSQRGALSLYVEDCLLPPGESIRVIRDNDSIRVKWDDCDPEEDAASSPSGACPPKRSKKRRRERSEDEDYTGIKGGKPRRLEETRDSDPVEKTRKEKKKKGKIIPDETAAQGESPRRKPAEKKKKEGKTIPGQSESPEKKKKHKVSKERSNVKASRKSLPKPTCDPEAKSLRQSASSDSSASSSDSDHGSSAVPKKPSKTPDKPPVSKAPIGSSGKAKSKEGSSSSSEEDHPKRSRKAAAATGLSETPQGKGGSPSSSDSSDSDSFIIKKPTVGTPGAGPPRISNGHAANSETQQWPPPSPGAWGRGIGRGRAADNSPWRGQRGGQGFRGRWESRNPGKGRGDGNPFFYSYGAETLKQQQLNEPAANTSVLIQNPPAESPRKDYSALPLLAAPPQTGRIIAFKLLELTENYTPEVSDYKEGRILSYDPVTQQLEVEVLSRLKKKEPGKFDLVYECADGTDIVEYAVPQDCKITQAWSSLIEPRLVMENGSEQRTLPPPGPVSCS